MNKIIKLSIISGLLFVLLTGCACNTKAVDTGKYACNYNHDGYIMSFDFIPGQTAEQDCKLFKDDDFFGKDKYKECLGEFAQKEKIYKSGECQKILTKVYNNLEGCTCNVYLLEDGTSHGMSCEGKYNDKKCNTDKAMKKLEWMLAK